MRGIKREGVVGVGLAVGGTEEGSMTGVWLAHILAKVKHMSPAKLNN